MNMKSFSRDEISKLALHREDSCVSLFLPTHRSTKQVQQGAIRLKNLAREASEQLIEGGKRPAEARDLLEPVTKLIEDDWFWQHQKDGLAIFLAPDLFRYYRLPRAFPELAVVARRFHLRPLLSVLSEDATFYVLGLGQNQVRLYEAGLDGLHEVELDSVPESLAEVMKNRESERQLQFHTRTPGIQGRPAEFHGHGDEAGLQKETMLQFFREVDKGVSEFLGTTQSPLVLAGVEYYFPLFREVSKYPRLLDEGISGSAEQMRPEKLHHEAWRLARPIINQTRDAEIQNYGNLSGTGKTAATLDRILPAAHHGRIQTLFLDEDQHVWGSYDVAREEVMPEREATADNEDLLDLAAVQTVLTSGTVYLLDQARMPERATVAAVLRY